MSNPLTLAEDFWKEVVDSLSDAVVVLDRGLVPLAMNPAVETLFAISHLAPAAFEDLLKENDWLIRIIEGCLSSGQSVSAMDASLRLGQRTTAVGAEITPLLNPADGECIGAVLLIRDLSMHRGAEHTIGASEPDLRLSPAGLAHEVKNPLTGIKGATELLATRCRSDPRAQQYCGVILEGVNRITALVEQVLAASAPQRLRLAPTNIHRVLHQALRMAGLHPHPPVGVTIEQMFDPSLPEITADGAVLERAFVNLIRNAAEAIGPHGTIRVRTRMETEFHLSAEGRSLQFLRVEISDSGPGMDAEHMAQLFTPFFTTKPAGTGLGLVLSQRIVAAHGGKLWAEAGGVPGRPAPRHGHAHADGHSGRGMTFKVTLPVGMREPETNEAA